MVRQSRLEGCGRQPDVCLLPAFARDGGLVHNVLAEADFELVMHGMEGPCSG